ncbi:MAG: hypothetical protein LEGION0398_MBIBDBAK_00238 [Legionellaceae bacterium]
MRYVKPFRITEPFSGLKSLSKERLEAIHSLFDDCQHAANIYNNSQHINRDELINGLKKADTAEDYQKIRANIQRLPEDNKANFVQRWQNSYLDKLWPYHEVSQIWNTDYIKNAIGQKRAWIDIYSAHTSKALYQLITYHLPELENTLHKVLADIDIELRQNSLLLEHKKTAKTIKAYQKEIRAYLAEIQKEKKAIASSLLHRLQFSSTQDNEFCDDILLGVTKAILHEDKKHKGTLWHTFELPKYQGELQERKGLKAHYAKAFIEYIEQHGSPKKKKVLSSLSWSPVKQSLSQHNEPLVSLYRHHTRLLVPHSLVNAIPRKTPFFKGARMRLNLALDCHVALETLSTPLNIEIKDSQTVKKSLEAFDLRFSLINQKKIALSQHKKTGFWGRWRYQKTNAFIQHFEGYFKVEEKALIEHQLAELEILGDSLKNLEITLSPETQSLLTSALRRIESYANSQKGIDTALFLRYQNIDVIINEKCAVLRQSLAILDNIINGEKVSKDEWKAFRCFHKTTSLYELPEHYTARLHQVFDVTKNRIKELFTTHRLYGNSKREDGLLTSKALIRDMLALKRFDREEDKIFITDAFSAYLESYLLDVANPSKATRLTDHEKLILSLTKEGRFLADETVNTAVKYLSEQRQEGASCERLQTIAGQISNYLKTGREIDLEEVQAIENTDVSQSPISKRQALSNVDEIEPQTLVF